MQKLHDSVFGTFPVAFGMEREDVLVCFTISGQLLVLQLMTKPDEEKDLIRCVMLRFFCSTEIDNLAIIHRTWPCGRRPCGRRHRASPSLFDWP
jgi:hypothetical protein